MTADAKRVGTAQPGSIASVWAGAATGGLGAAGRRRGGPSPLTAATWTGACVGERDRRPHPKVTAPRVSGQERQLEAAGLAAGAAGEDVDEEDEDVDDEEDDAGVAAGVDAAALRAVDFAPARASLR